MKIFQKLNFHLEIIRKTCDSVTFALIGHLPNWSADLKQNSSSHLQKLQRLADKLGTVIFCNFLQFAIQRC